MIISKIMSMNHSISIRMAISVFVCIVLFACHNSVRNSATSLLSELQQAEFIMYESPDSALRLLQSMPVPQPSDRLQYATWALFTTQARYKLYMQQSDSLINIAYDFFMKQGDTQRKALALYYKGAICKEQQQIEEAHKYFLQAAEEVEKTTDYQLGHLIYVGLADTYAYQHLNEYALKAAQEAHRYAIASKSYNYISSALVLQARICSSLTKYNESIEYYKKAMSFAKDKQRNGIKCELASVFNKVRDYDSALYYVREMMDLNNEYSVRENAAGYLVSGETYYNIGKIDSAIYYFQQTLTAYDVNITQITDAHQQLYFAYKQKKDYQSAAEHCFEMSWYLDSLHRADKSRALIEIQEKYDQQKLINEKNVLKIKKDAVVRNSLIGLAVAMLLVASLIYVYQKKLLRKERRIQEAEEKIRSKSVHIQENEQLINRNRMRMQELEEQMEAGRGMQEELEEQRKTLAEIARHNEQLEEENRGLQRDIDGMSAILKEKSVELEQLDVLSKENLRLHDREWFLSSLLLEKDETLRCLKHSPHYIREEEWEAIKRSVDQLFDHFTKRLTAAIPSLTENELQLCCLIRLHFSNSAIATMLAIEAASVSKRKFRLKERIIQKTGTWSAGTTLELWLWNF